MSQIEHAMPNSGFHLHLFAHLRWAISVKMCCSSTVVYVYQEPVAVTRSCLHFCRFGQSKIYMWLQQPDAVILVQLSLKCILNHLLKWSVRLDCNRVFLQSDSHPSKENTVAMCKQVFRSGVFNPAPGEPIKQLPAINYPASQGLLNSTSKSHRFSLFLFSCATRVSKLKLTVCSALFVAFINIWEYQMDIQIPLHITLTSQTRCKKKKKKDHLHTVRLKNHNINLVFKINFQNVVWMKSIDRMN